MKAYPLEQLGVEKRSMAGAVLMGPPVVETGDVSVVAKEGLLESSFSLCSWVETVQFKYRHSTGIPHTEIEHYIQRLKAMIAMSAP